MDPDTSAVKSVIALQYNPDSLTRTLQIQAMPGGQDGVRVDALRLRGPASRNDQARSRTRRDRSARVSQTIPHRCPVRPASPARAAGDAGQSDASRRCRPTTAMANAGTLEIIPLEQPLTLFVWSKSRVVPVRLTEFSDHRRSLRPAAESDSREGQPGHAGIERRRSRLLASGRPHVHDLPRQQGAARLAGGRRRHFGPRPGRLAMNYPLAGADPAGRVPPVTFPTDSRYYGSSTLTYTAPNGQADHLSRAPFRTPAGSAQLFDGRAAHGQARRPARSDRRQISRRSVDVLADLRRQRRHPARRIWLRLPAPS